MVRAHVSHESPVTRLVFALTEGGDRPGGTPRGTPPRAGRRDLPGGYLGRRVRHHRRSQRVLHLHLPRRDGRPRVDGLIVRTVPGITAMQDLAAPSGTVLVRAGSHWR